RPRPLPCPGGLPPRADLCHHRAAGSDPALPEGDDVIDLLIKIIINAIAVYVAVLLVPQISFPAADQLLKLEGNWWHVVVVALILALINSYVKPILKVLSFPITLLSLGLFALVLNA